MGRKSTSASSGGDAAAAGSSGSKRSRDSVKGKADKSANGLSKKDASLQSSSKKNKNAKVKTKAANTVESLIAKHKFLSIVNTDYGEKVECELTKHQIKPKVELIEQHLRSKKLERAQKGWFKDDWVEEFLPWIVPHKRDAKRLYCTLTQLAVNKIPEEVEKHVNGKRFLRLKEAELERQAKAEAKAARKRSPKPQPKVDADVDMEEEEEEESGSSSEGSSGSGAESESE
jgi:hypothetical protein